MLPRLARIAALAAIVVAGAVHTAAAQGAQATRKDAGAIRACAEKYAENINEAERRCIFAIVVEPCTKTRVGRSSQGAAACYHVEQDIWDELLNENFRVLRDGLDDDQKEKLRQMQRDWIAYRNTTCEFYYHKIQGTMATEMTAACLARETARRALLLKFFQGL
ncbi:MAG TPA: lysozyme inhibitor LprI family protein [Xanthobacteraceae bacterium]|nr:lysozyme inhibitor LprI family protein [Xanthobacteraceae bacterium]